MSKILSRRVLCQSALASTLLSTFPVARAANSITLWGPPVGPTALLQLVSDGQPFAMSTPTIAQAWRTPDQLRAGLVNGEMPITVVPSYVAANFYNQGKAVGLINIMTFGLLNIIGKQGAISALEDLVGKTIAMPFKNDMPDLILRALLQKVGVPVEKINFQYTATPPETAMLMVSGKVDVALLPEPAASMAITKSQKTEAPLERLLSIQDLWGDYLGEKPRIPQAGLLVSQDFYDANGDYLSELHQQLSLAVAWAKDHTQEAAEANKDIMKMPVPILQQSLQHSNLTVTPSVEIQDEIMSFFEVLYGLNPKILGGKTANPDVLWPTSPIT